MTIGEKIYSLRTGRNLSQDELAELLGVSRQSVSKWETNSSTPEIEKLSKICDIFRISLDELTGRNIIADKVIDGVKNVTADEFGETLRNTNCIEENQTEKEDTDILTENKENIQEPASEEKKSYSPIKKIIAAVTACCILLCVLIVPSVFKNEIKKLWWNINGGKIEYTNVLVHGLGGWGADAEISSYINYWGGGSDNLVKYLNEQGFRTVAPSVGPVSSTWDRACELYAQLTGTTVDYGEVHSKKHNHARYGRTYTSPLVENWGDEMNGGQLVKINLIGHSFGGTTARYLAFLLEYGNEAETEASGNSTSPLFTGNKGEWVHSVTTLCTPHNGSSLTEILEKTGKLLNIGSLTDLLLSLCFYMGTESDSESLYDIQLDQFGLDETPVNKTAFKNAVDKVISSGNDHAGYELSPDGAARLNHTMKTANNIYYFSYSYSTTYQGDLLDIQLPKIGTLPILSPLATAMGAYKGTSADGILIENSWRENDGLVNVISAKYPFGETYCEYNEENILPGIWNVLPVRTGDHGNVIGLNSDITETHQFWTDLLYDINSLPRMG